MNDIVVSISWSKLELCIIKSMPMSECKAIASIPGSGIKASKAAAESSKYNIGPTMLNKEKSV